MVNINVLPRDTLSEADELGCWNAIQAGVHSVTERRIPAGEEQSLKAAAEIVNQWRWHDDFQLVQQQQQLVNAAMVGGPAGAIRDHMNILMQQRQYPDSLLDQELVRRLTGGLDDELMRRATMLHEPDALRLVREQVHGAAAAQITDQWQALDLARQHSDRLASVIPFDPLAMAGEAQRMLLVYGPALAEQSRFLSEYHANLGLFSTTRLTRMAYERADLLARAALPAAFATSVDCYDPVNIERIHAYSQSVLQELEADFRRCRNPVHAWEAVAVSAQNRIDPPLWVHDFVADMANRVLEIRDEVAGGKPVRREAERVGKALGFGTDGSGRGGLFKAATMLQRDRAIYIEVRDRLQKGVKLDFAYDDVAKRQNLSRSTIARAYSRIVKLVEEPGVQINGLQSGS